MSSKTRTVDHGGIPWKVIPGSRREQILLRMIRQDDLLNHADVPNIEVVDDSWFAIVWTWIGVAIGAGAMGFVWWLI